MKLGGRMARRNHLHLFAWLCAVALPAALQWFAGANEDVLNYLQSYYGPITLYIFFIMSFGLATVFVSYYVVSGFRTAGTLDTLRISRIRPAEVVGGVFLQLEQLLIPPVLGFAALFLVYLLYFAGEGARGIGWTVGGQGQVLSLGWGAIVAGAVVMLLNQAVLAALMCCGLYRREALLALFAALLVLPLNSAPVLVVYVYGVPWWTLLLIMLVLLALLFLLAVHMLSRLWPPQKSSPA